MTARFTITVRTPEAEVRHRRRCRVKRAIAAALLVVAWVGTGVIDDIDPTGPCMHSALC